MLQAQEQQEGGPKAASHLWISPSFQTHTSLRALRQWKEFLPARLLHRSIELSFLSRGPGGMLQEEGAAGGGYGLRTSKGARPQLHTQNVPAPSSLAATTQPAWPPPSCSPSHKRHQVLVASALLLPPAPWFLLLTHCLLRSLSCDPPDGTASWTETPGLLASCPHTGVPSPWTPTPPRPLSPPQLQELASCLPGDRGPAKPANFSAIWCSQLPLLQQGPHPF